MEEEEKKEAPEASTEAEEPTKFKGIVDEAELNAEKPKNVQDTVTISEGLVLLAKKRKALEEDLNKVMPCQIQETSNGYTITIDKDTYYYKRPKLTELYAAHDSGMGAVTTFALSCVECPNLGGDLNKVYETPTPEQALMIGRFWHKLFMTESFFFNLKDDPIRVQLIREGLLTYTEFGNMTFPQLQAFIAECHLHDKLTTKEEPKQITQDKETRRKQADNDAMDVVQQLQRGENAGNS